MNVLSWRHVAHAIAKCTKGERGMASFGLVVECDCEERDIAYDGRREGSDEEQNASCKETEDGEPAIDQC